MARWNYRESGKSLVEMMSTLVGGSDILAVQTATLSQTISIVFGSPAQDPVSKTYTAFNGWGAQ
jgi:hypothetical protein